MDLTDLKSWINEQILMIYGQMDEPSLILDYLYLGTEWNACNLEELQENGKLIHTSFQYSNHEYHIGKIQIHMPNQFDFIKLKTIRDFVDTRYIAMYSLCVQE